MSPDPSPIVARYIGYTKDTENHGDEALIGIVRDLLAPEIEVRTDCEDYELALLGGGTLINQSPWLLDVFGQALEKAQHGVVFGSGVGDPAFWGDRFEDWAELLNRCDFVGVRGPDSEALLKSNGVEHAQCVGDPYLWISTPVERQPIPKRLCVNAGSTNDSLWGTNDEDLIRFLSEVLIRLKHLGWSFAWVSVWSRDIPLLEKLRQSVDHGSIPVLDARTRNREAFSAIADSELFLGEKLHANAMAAVVGVPFIALEYQPKILDFTKSLNMEDWTISTAERDPNLLIEKIQSVRSQREEIRGRMLKSKNVLRDRLIEFAGRVRNRFGRTGC
jgi:polysaccharide pyruvyl transferase WcaK-like protein